MPGQERTPWYRQQQEEIEAARLAAVEAEAKKTAGNKKAASLAAAQGNRSGVFSLDELNALGQTGDLKKDWMQGSSASNGLIAGGGRAVIPTDMPAGYYHVPGQEGAEYFDPKSGQVSAALANYLSTAKRDYFTGAPEGLINDSRDRGLIGLGTKDQGTLASIISKGRGDDGTYQDSQDRTLGIGAYQQFVTGRDGKQVRIADATGYAPAPQYTDRGRPIDGSFDRLLKLTGQDQATLDKTLGLDTSKPAVAGYWKRMEDSLASNYEVNALKQHGLAEQRTARGLDATTGISEAEKRRIYDVYGSITDPGMRDTYLKAQDPGNLTPELRALRAQLRAPELGAAAHADADVQAQRKEYYQPGMFGTPDAAKGRVELTRGSALQIDATTGREMLAGNIPIAAEFKAPKDTSWGEGLTRAGGGVMGGTVGFITGGPMGAIAGAYAGAGGPMPKKGTWAGAAAGAALGFATGNWLGALMGGYMMGEGADKSRGSGLNTTRYGQPQFMDLRQVGTALIFARMSGGGVYGAGAPTMTSAQRGALFAH